MQAATMIDDNTPYRVFKISELTRLIAGQLVLISRKSTTNLARVCRSLEDPVLSTLWETQLSLPTLLKVLPEETWKFRCSSSRFEEDAFEVVGDPSPEDWNRVQRYASWMRQVRVNEWSSLGKETFEKLRLNSPPGGWFPALQGLSWTINESNLPYTDICFSPDLKEISIRAIQSWNNTGVPLGILPTLVSTISALPTSSLERISVDIKHQTIPWADAKDSFSSIVLRCGPSFIEYDCPVPLSDAALDHLIQLPHFRTWRIHGPPPDYPASSLPLVFPPLRKLTLGKGAVRGWLPLLERLDGASTTQDVTPLSKAKESLIDLKIDDIPDINIGAPFVSTIQRFRNLVFLKVEVYCHDEDDRGQCAFKLNNDDVTELAMTLTRLECLCLGYPCFENTCLTTVACLLPISVHCNELRDLAIHFNTTNIADDFKNILEDPQFQQLRSLRRCPLRNLDVHQMPLDLDESGYRTVVNGMADIFPRLKGFGGFEEIWHELCATMLATQYAQMKMEVMMGTKHRFKNCPTGGCEMCV